MMNGSCIASLSLITLFALTVACDAEHGSSGADSSPPPGNASESIQHGSGFIGSSGGEVHSNDGNLRLNFAESALEDKIQISIESRPGVHRNLVSKLYELKPNGVTFDPPVNVTLLITGIHAYKTGTVAVVRFDSGSPEILEVPHHCGEGANAEPTGFSTHGMVTLDTTSELSERWPQCRMAESPAAEI